MHRDGNKKNKSGLFLNDISYTLTQAPRTTINYNFNMSVFATNKTALITGGASGIGLAVAQLCRKHAMKVAIVDNNAEYLAKAKETLKNDESADVETYELDVSKIEQWKDLKDKIAAKFGKIDFLMLNAGIGARGTWGDSEYFHKVCFDHLRCLNEAHSIDF
jgi:NAD(P)-dependent dehydrogenase (short-subunit alcohol dehydrogenase family)